MAKSEKRKTCHERVDVATFLESRDSDYTEMFREMVWYSLDKICELKLGPNHKKRSLKQKKDWVLSQGWETIVNKDGVEGVAIAKEDEGVMTMRVGSRFSADKVKRETFENTEADGFDSLLFAIILSVCCSNSNISCSIYMALGHINTAYHAAYPYHIIFIS